MSYIDEALGIEFKHRYPEDVVRIRRVALEHGYTLTPQQAQAVWDSYSDDMAAGWMILPEDDDELWEIIS